MDSIIVIAIVVVLIILSAHFSDNDGIIGFIANLFWYLWRKLWMLFIILMIVSLLFGGLPQTCA